MPATNVKIEALRQDISLIDQEIFELIKRREKLSARIGKAKLELRIPIRDFAREKEIFDKAKTMASELGLPQTLVLGLQEQLIKISLSRQEKDRIKATTQNSPQSVSIIGGSGRLGMWLARFFYDLGHAIHVVDPIKPDFDCHFSTSLDDSLGDRDLIVVATPIRTTKEVLADLTRFDLTKPVVFDVASVKSPIQHELFNLRDRGVAVSSLHPMFGPSVELLFGKHLIRCSLGVTRADQTIDGLFSATSLKIVDMGIEEHDEIISYLLSLSHVVSLLFVAVLGESGCKLSTLEAFSSPTFSSILEVAKRVVKENPKLYFEIQNLNPKNHHVYDLLKKNINDILHCIAAGEDTPFVGMMTRCRNYVEANS